jgi:hypothetical protein
MPRRSSVDPDFKRHVCAQIDSYITANGLTDVEAARVLGVRKQMIKPYRLGVSLPGTEAIARACIHWNLRFTYRGVELSANQFAATNGRPAAIPLQLQLPFNIPVEFEGVSETVQNVQMVVTLRRVS